MTESIISKCIYCGATVQNNFCLCPNCGSFLSERIIIPINECPCCGREALSKGDECAYCGFELNPENYADDSNEISNECSKCGCAIEDDEALCDICRSKEGAE